MADAVEAQDEPDQAPALGYPQGTCFYCKLPTLLDEDVIRNGITAHRYQRTCDERKAGHVRTDQRARAGSGG